MIKNALTANVVRQNISFVFNDVVCCSSHLTALQTLLSSSVFEVWQNVQHVDHSKTEQRATNSNRMLCIVGFKVQVKF